jgi:hypothetical protein
VKPVAVLFVHGVEIDDPNYAEVPEQLLRKYVARALGQEKLDTSAKLIVDAVNWAKIIEDQQRRLLHTMYPSDTVEKLFERLRELIVKLNRGEVLLPLVELAATLVKRDGLFSRAPLKFAAARWVLIHFVGDVVAYERTPSADANYTRIHEAYAQALARLAARVPPNTPLVVIAHSLGTVISSNFFYDLETARAATTQLGATPPSPFLRGETLCSFYTLGSPLPIWLMRYPDRPFDQPLQVPANELALHHPQALGEWVNYLDDDDLIAYPLRGLSDAYARMVKADVTVKLRGSLFSWQPLVHPYYWTDARVMRPVGEAIAKLWLSIQ